MNAHLTIKTSIGDFTIFLDLENAPITAGYFKGIAEDHGFNNSSVFRIVNEYNAELRSNAKIEVIQMGINDLNSKYSTSLKHETTKLTGLLHEKWTVSAARYDVGQNYPSFFICMRDEPELDHGGKRHPDGEGFAAFGKVIEGFDAVEKLFLMAEQQEYLKNKIEVVSTELKCIQL